MERKNITAIVAGLGFVAAMFALSQVRSYSCGDFKRIQYEYVEKLKPLLKKVCAADSPLIRQPSAATFSLKGRRGRK
jgi:hypothetical protein